MEMYVWKVTVEIEYEGNYMEGGEQHSETWTEEKALTIASPSGILAIERAKIVAITEEEPWDNADYKEKNEPLKSYKATAVKDITHLELLETLDG